MSGAIVPSGPGGASFQQQGQVDWVALSNSSLSFTVDVLARFAKADLHAGTVAISNFVCSGFALKPVAQKRIRDALQKLESFQSYGSVLWFGFGIRPIIRDLADSEHGAACVALCACLAVSYDSFFAAQVLRDLCNIHHTPQNFVPALYQWETLVNVCSGSLSGSNFPALVQGFSHLVSSKPLPRAEPTSSEALAKALHALSELSQGMLANVQLMGGVDCLWLAAVAEWLLCLRVEIVVSGTVRYQSSSILSGPEARIGTSQVTVVFDQDLGTMPQNQQLLSRKCYVIPSGRTIVNIELHGPNGNVFMGGRSTWAEILQDTFGSSFSCLLEEPILKDFATVLLVASAAAESHYRDGHKGKSQFFHSVQRYRPFHFARSTSRGQGYLTFASRLLPELTPAVRAAAKIQQDTPFQADFGWKQVMEKIKNQCRCTSCCVEPSWGQNLCLVLVTEAILTFTWLLSAMDAAESLQPSSTGLMFLYDMQTSATNMGLTLLDAAMAIFSGTVRTRLETDKPSAMSSNGLCVYFRALEDLDGPPEEISIVRVVPGQIEFQGIVHHAVFDMVDELQARGESDPQGLRQISCKLLAQERRQPGAIDVAYSLAPDDSWGNRHLLGVSELITTIANTIRAPLQCHKFCRDWNFPHHPRQTLVFSRPGDENHTYPEDRNAPLSNLGWSIIKYRPATEQSNRTAITVHRTAFPKLYLHLKEDFEWVYRTVYLDTCLTCVVRLSVSMATFPEAHIDPKGTLSTALELADNNLVQQTFYFYLIKHQTSALEQACLSGESEFTQLIRTIGQDAEARDDRGYTILHQIVELGHKAMVQILLDAGVYVNTRNNYTTALHLAARKNDVPMTKLLLGSHADINAGGNRGTPLHLAAQHGNEAVVKVLIDSGAILYSGKEVGKTPLHVAAAKGHEGVVKLLLDSGVDSHRQDDCRATPLHHAALMGHEGVVKLLLDSGASVNGIDESCCTPLHLAAQGDHEGVVKLLLDFGARVDEKDGHHRTPLHRAVREGNEGMVKLLLNAGAGPCHASLSFAVEKGFHGIEKLLREKGATE